MTTAETHIKQADGNLADAARSLALALEHDPRTVTTFTGLQRELLLRYGLRRVLLRAERSLATTTQEVPRATRPRR